MGFLDFKDRQENLHKTGKTVEIRGEIWKTSKEVIKMIL